MELSWIKYVTVKDSTVITTLDAHAAGEPLRIITGGLPETQGTTILERRRYMLEHLDYIRRALMWEPRGHYNMYGCVITEPVSSEADIGVLFMHNEGYSTMCGHGIIALVTVLLETGTSPAQEQLTPIKLDTPPVLLKLLRIHPTVAALFVFSLPQTYVTHQQVQVSRLVWRCIIHGVK